MPEFFSLQLLKTLNVPIALHQTFCTGNWHNLIVFQRDISLMRSEEGNAGWVSGLEEGIWAEVEGEVKERGEFGVGVGLLGALSLSGRQSVVLLLGDGNGQMGLISLKISHQLQEVSISHHLEPL